MIDERPLPFIPVPAMDVSPPPFIPSPTTPRQPMQSPGKMVQRRGLILVKLSLKELFTMR